MKTIKFYTTKTGKCPVEEFLDSLTSQQAKKVTWVLKLIEDLERVPVQYFKKLVSTDDIWEVRVKVGNNIFRILGFFDGASLIILNHAFTKKTKKTPKKEIQIAEKRKADYLRRNSNE